MTTGIEHKRWLKTHIASALSILVMLFASLVGLPATAANARSTDVVQAAIIRNTTGTGHGTTNACYITAAKGFTPGDDSATDAYVCNGDGFKFTSQVTVATGAAAEKYRLTWTAPGGVAWDTSVMDPACRGGAAGLYTGTVIANNLSQSTNNSTYICDITVAANTAQLINIPGSAGPLMMTPNQKDITPILTVSPVAPTPGPTATSPVTDANRVIALSKMQIDISVTGSFTTAGPTGFYWGAGPAAGDGNGLVMPRMTAAPLNYTASGYSHTKGAQTPLRVNNTKFYFDLSGYPEGTKVFNCGTNTSPTRGYVCSYDATTKVVTLSLANTSAPISLVNQLSGYWNGYYGISGDYTLPEFGIFIPKASLPSTATNFTVTYPIKVSSTPLTGPDGSLNYDGQEPEPGGTLNAAQPSTVVCSTNSATTTPAGWTGANGFPNDNCRSDSYSWNAAITFDYGVPYAQNAAGPIAVKGTSKEWDDAFGNISAMRTEQSVNGTYYVNGYEAGTPVWHVASIGSKEVVTPNLVLCDQWNATQQHYDAARQPLLYFRDLATNTMKPLDPAKYKVQYTNVATAGQSQTCGSSASDSFNGGNWYNSPGDVPGGTDAINGVRFVLLEPLDLNSPSLGQPMVTMYVPAKPRPIAEYTLDANDFSPNFTSYFNFTADASSATPTYQGPRNYSWRIREDNLAMQLLQQAADTVQASTGFTVAPAANMRINFWMQQNNPTYDQPEVPQLVVTLDNCVMNPVLLGDSAYWDIEYIPAQPGPSGYICGSTDAIPGKVIITAKKTVLASEFPISTYQNQFTLPQGNRSAHPFALGLTVNPAAENGLIIKNTSTLQDIATPYSIEEGGTGASSSTIRVVAASVATIAKTTTTPQLETRTDEPLLWTFNYYNGLETSAGRTQFIDRFPYNGDPGGSKFSGALNLTAITPGVGSTAQIEYTKTASAAVSNNPADATNQAGGATIWCTSFTAGGDCPAAIGEVTAMRVTIPDFGPKMRGGIVVTAEPTGQNKGDVFINQTGEGVAANLARNIPATSPVSITIVSSTITGRVFTDVDENKALNLPPDTGIGGVTVHLLNADGTPYLINGTAVTAVTAPDGTYTFVDLTAGSYLVQVDRGTTLPAVAENTVTYASPMVNTTNPKDTTTAFNVVLAATVPNVDFGFTQVYAGALTVTGVATDTGTGGAGKSVNALAALGENITTVFTVTNTGTAVANNVGMTLPDGTVLVPAPGAGYTIVDGKVSGLQPGATVNFAVAGAVATAADMTAGQFARTATVTGTFKATTNASETPVPTTTAMTATASVPAAVAVSGLVFTDTNKNGVLDAGEPPIANAALQILDGANAAQGAATTAADGTYAFTDLPAGTYSVQATAPANQVFTTRSTDPASTTGSQADAAGLTYPYTLTAGQARAEAQIGLIPTPAPALTVMGGIEDLGDNGFALNNIASVGETVRKTYTITNTGNVTMTDVKPTTGDNPVTATGATSVTLAPGESMTFTVDVVVTPAMVAAANAQTGTDVGLILAPVTASGQAPTPPNSTTAPALTTATAPTDNIPVAVTISGLVWDDTNFNGVQGVGEPVKPGVVVELRDGTGVVIKTQTTSPTGAYVFTDLPAGDYVVHVVAPAGYVLSPQSVGTDTTVDSDVNAAGDTATLSPTVGQTVPFINAGMRLAGMPTQTSTGIQGTVQTVTPQLTPDDPTVPLVPSTTTIAPPATVPPGVVYTQNPDGSITVTKDGTPIGTFDTVKGPDGTPTGDITFTPDPAFTGEAPPIVVTQKDANDTPTSVLLTPTVTPVNPTVPAITPNTGPQGIPLATTPIYTPGDPSIPMDPSTTTIAPPAVVPPGTTYTVNPDGTITVTKDGAVIGTFSLPRDAAGNPTGDVLFTPVPSFVGVVPPLDVTQKDTNGTPAVTSLQLTITPVTPTAPIDGTKVTTPQGTPITSTPIFNSGNPDVPMDPKTTTIAPPAVVPPGVVYTPNPDGTISVVKDGVPIGTYTPGVGPDGQPDGTVTFTPDPSFTGEAPPISVSQKDKNGTVVTTTLTPTVTPVQPTVLNLTSTGIQGKTQLVDAVAAATGANGIRGNQPGSSIVPSETRLLDATGAPTLAPVPALKDGVQVGTYELVLGADGLPTGVIAFKPNPTFVGTPDPVSYTVGDANGLTSNVGTYTPTVTAVTPGAATDEQDSTGVQTQPQLITPNFVPGDPTVPMDPKTTAIVPPATVPPGVVYTPNPDGSLTVTKDGIPVGTFTPTKDPAGVPTGDITFTPAPDFIGAVPPVVVTQKDTNGTVAEITVNATVTPGVPIAQSDLDNVGAQGVPQVIDVVTIATGANGISGSDPKTSLDPAATRLLDSAGQPTTDPVPATKDGVVVGSWSLGVDAAGVPNGTIVFTPNSDFVGTVDPADFIVGDTNGNVSTPAQVAATTTAVVPTGPADGVSSTGPQNTPQTIAIPFTPGDPNVPMDPSTTTLRPPATVVPGEVYTPNPDGSVTVTRDGLPVGTFVPGKNAAGVPDGTVVFTPDANFTGAVPPIDVVQKDTNGTEAVTRLTVTVTPTPPTAVDESSVGPQGLPQTINVIGDATGGNGVVGSDPATSIDPTLTRLLDAAGNPTLGPVPATKDGVQVGTWTVGVGADGKPDGTIVFTPNADFVGTADPAPFILGDVNGTVSAPKTVTATTTAVTPSGPTAPVTSTGDQGDPQIVKIPFTPGDPNVPMDPKTTAIQPPANVPPGVVYEPQPDGSIKVSKDGVPIGVFDTVKNPDGTPTGDISFTPDPSFVGTAPPIEVTQKDTNGTVATTTLTPSVRPVPPMTVDVSGTNHQGATVVVDVLKGSTGANGIAGGAEGTSLVPELTRLIDAAGNPTLEPVPVFVDGKQIGVYSLNLVNGKPNGLITFTPIKTYFGEAPPVKFVVGDVNGKTASAYFTPTITKVTPTPPPISDQPPATTKDKPVVYTPVFVPGHPDVPMDPKTTVIKPPSDVPPGVVYEPQPDGSIKVIKDGTPIGVFKPGVDSNGDPDGTITFTPEPGFTGDVPPIVVVQRDTNGTPAEVPWGPKVTGGTDGGLDGGNTGRPSGTQGKPIVPPTAPVSPVVPGTPVAPAPPLLDRLARTGADAAPYLGLFGLLTAAGALLVVAGRRRRR